MLFLPKKLVFGQKKGEKTRNFKKKAFLLKKNSEMFCRLKKNALPLHPLNENNDGVLSEELEAEGSQTGKTL